MTVAPNFIAQTSFDAMGQLKCLSQIKFTAVVEADTRSAVKSFVFFLCEELWGHVLP